MLLLLPGVASAQAVSHLPEGAPVVQASSEAERTWFATTYADRKAVGNLWDIVRHADDVTYDRDYLAGGAISYVVSRDVRIPIPFTDRVAAPILEIEGQLDRHFGRGTLGSGHHVQGSADTVEAVVAAVIRTRDFPLFSGISLNLALGDGPSYSFPDPRWEFGHRRFNNYLTAQVELTSTAVPWLHLVPQIHHRSGAGGLIAPIADGSNFLGLGLRVDLN
ncbi:MAG TPA: hypothetical protein VN808_21350 [Stellaceae bacterium]|nr:hypothetical protein [Stellaceae bacterium]